MLLKLLLLAFILPVCSIGPGLFFVRRLPWAPAERLPAALGLSFCLLYGTSFLIFLGGWAPEGYLVVSGICLACTALCAADLARLWRNRDVRRQCMAFGALFLWGFLLLSLIRHYSGGICSVDWLEHYQRTLYFIVHPAQPPQWNGLPVPSRPPFMNLLAAHFLGHFFSKDFLIHGGDSGLGFELFQVIFLYLNLLIVFPLCLMLRLFDRRGMGNLPVLIVLLMSNPLLWWNVTWTWTKVFTGFYVISALWFYLAGLRKNDWARTALAFFFLAAGSLAHFSAGPYALAIGVHYFGFVFRGTRFQWRALAVGGLAASALMATWFGYSAYAFGPKSTFTSNSTSRGFAADTLDQNALKIVHNIAYSIVPHPLHVSRPTFDESLGQPSKVGYFRDYVLMIWNPNFILSMGSVGGFLVIYLILRLLRSSPSGKPHAGRSFWLPFIIISALAGIAVHPTEDAFGVAHICGQPLIYLGVTFLAARFWTLPRAAQWLAIAACLVDFALGILLQFHVEHQVIKLTAPIVSNDALVQARWTPPDNDLSKWAGFNWKAKMLTHVVYLGDHCDHLAVTIQVLVVLAFGLGITVLIRSLTKSAAAEPTGCGESGIART
jgi:hypothetical protein